MNLLASGAEVFLLPLINRHESNSFRAVVAVLNRRLAFIIAVEAREVFLSRWQQEVTCLKGAIQTVSTLTCKMRPRVVPPIKEVVRHGDRGLRLYSYRGG